ncbi:EAL domain-containing protein [Alloalcanivorax xenomutans]|uniref:EAL domain-containing protein n=1 Tax=Alloalcanivorax xenomutans TaxID=1094342 RepID=UPI0024E1AF5E|nr:EAL domain-containing protein [Alloalcanivorax xenomutans]
MPLHDLVDYFNREQRRQYGTSIVPKDTLRMRDNTVEADYAGLVLRSRFQPILPLCQEGVYGHEALLSVHGKGGPLSPQALFMIPTSADEIVYLDRLCRTVHALNFLLQPDTGGLLSLNIHPRHLASVRQDHGLAFEQILRQCGLAPEQVILEIRHDPAGTEDPRRAVESYRRHGYRIALDNVTSTPSTTLWRALAPDMVKLAPELETAERDTVLDSAARHGTSFTLQLGLTTDLALRYGLSHVQARALAPPAEGLTGPTWRRGAFP